MREPVAFGLLASVFLVMAAHTFNSHLEWSGRTRGTTGHPEAFSRDMNVTFEGVTIPVSAAPAYGGDPRRANPEQLFVAALSACQALTYLSLCAKRRIGVVDYTDDADGRLEAAEGKMRMTHVVLRPRVTLESQANEAEARELIERAHHFCFIANSVSAVVAIVPTFTVADAPAPAMATSGGRSAG
jgi:organic hydroperoxide reductase OsmC/OhrA